MECLAEGFPSCRINRIGLAVMHLIGGHQPDAGVMMLLIVPIEEGAAERLGVRDAAKYTPTPSEPAKIACESPAPGFCSAS